MSKKGFASMYLVYSFFLVFIMVMLTVLMVNTYKKNFLNTLKSDIKDTLSNHKIIEEFPITNEKSYLDPEMP